MIPQTELDLGRRSAERERYVIHALQLYTKNTGHVYFSTHVAEAMSRGNSAWGYLKYPQDREYPKKQQWKNDNWRNGCINKAISDLRSWGVFEMHPQSFYRTYSDYCKLKEHNLIDVEFGLYASKRTYRVITEISKFNSIKDYKLFGTTKTGKKYKLQDGTYFQGSSWTSKLRGYYYIEVDDLIELGLIDSTDGSKGYKVYSLNEHGREFMDKNQQWKSEDYRI